MTSTTFSTKDDLALQSRVRDRLERCGHAAMRAVSCTVEQGCIRLTGRTRTYYLKQLAQELARATPGAGEIANEIRVGNPVRHPSADHV
ncbi:MAG TPA: BON domain-containing protein [Pirellulaceae bacterium]|jgi:osmotically-inducible protein OsmY|nr:BON domain-containing protein [Pirellulaceae bacterium]